MIQVAFVDDHELMRKGTIALLSCSEIEFIIEAENGPDLLRQLEEATILPDICLVDISMPLMDGFTLVEELKKRWPQIRSLVLTAYNSEMNIIRMIKAGARGYLLKSASPTEIKEAIQITHQKGFYFSELFSDRLLDQINEQKITPVSFTEREIEFLNHCCSSLSYDEIAAEMGISSRTIHGYCERTFAKFGVNSRIGLIVLALKSGIITN